MAVQIGLPKKAAGDRADTGTPITRVAVKREMKSSVPVNDGSAFSENGYSGPSSETLIGKTRADMTVNNDDTDQALAAVKQRGAGRSDQTENWQTRELSAAGGKNVPDGFGMTRQTKDAPDQMPSKIGATNAPVARKP
jgi:hypothetical protein